MKDTTNLQRENFCPGAITQQIQLIRNHRVLLDADLAALYGVSTKVLVQAVKRNLNRFPSDFMFQLNADEWNFLRSQSVTSKAGSGGRRYTPYAFTEHGVAMLSSVLNSAQAIAVNIEIMRTFLRLRETIESNKELALRLEELQSKAELIELKHDTFEHNTRLQLKQVFEIIRELMVAPEPPKERSASNTSGLPCCSLPCSWLEPPCLRKSVQIDAALRHPTNSPCRNQWPA